MLDIIFFLKKGPPHMVTSLGTLEQSCSQPLSILILRPDFPKGPVNMGLAPVILGS